MIDFRYHIVSLISVFLALAVGIVLGAGPLREGISDVLTGQVQELRVDRDNLRAQLDVSNRTATGRADLLTALEPDAVAGTLQGQRIAVVTLPEAGATDALITALQDAGAQVSAQASVAEAMTNPDTAAFRSSFSGQIAGYLKPAPPANASTEELLGHALAQAMGRTGEATDADTIAEFLSSTDPALISVTAAPETTATALVIVAGSEAEEKDADASRIEALSRVAAGASQVLPTVVIGDANDPTALIPTIRGGDLASSISTVDSVSGPVGAINLPRTLAGVLQGTVGHYGAQPGASAVLAPLPAAPAPTASPSSGE